MADAAEELMSSPVRRAFDWDLLEEEPAQEEPLTGLLAYWAPYYSVGSLVTLNGLRASEREELAVVLGMAHRAYFVEDTKTGRRHLIAPEEIDYDVSRVGPDKWTHMALDPVGFWKFAVKYTLPGLARHGVM